ncbi:hypothetical protein Scep_020173 [Stephania cephalantha]|uniref:Uncharacterized protein n=1 Tax=Stephania cephalantha TaxID=152367 RepID=A0AAP0IC49_9MAGN
MVKAVGVHVLRLSRLVTSFLSNYLSIDRSGMAMARKELDRIKWDRGVPEEDEALQRLAEARA